MKKFEGVKIEKETKFSQHNILKLKIMIVDTKFGNGMVLQLNH